MSKLDNRGDGTSSGTQNLVQISLYSSVIRSKEVNSFTTLELFELDHKQPTILFQDDNSKFFNEILRKISLHAILISQEQNTKLTLTIAQVIKSNTFSNLVGDESPLSTIDLFSICSRKDSQFIRRFY